MPSGGAAKPKKAAGDPLKNLSAMEEELTSTFLSSLVCSMPKCRNYLYTPIRQCAEGHTLCIVCLDSKSQVCSLCKKPILPVSNVALESIASKLIMACKNREMGCPKTFLKNPDAIKIHELQCPYRPYSCFATKCSWKGRSSDLCLHMAESHAERVFTGEEKVFKIKKMDNREDMEQMSLMVTAFGSFWTKIVFQKATGMFFGAVQYVGPSKLAGNCTYRFEIVAEEQSAKKQLIYSRHTHEDTVSFDTIFNSAECFCLPIGFAQYLSVNNVLQIKLNLEHVKPH